MLSLSACPFCGCDCPTLVVMPAKDTLHARMTENGEWETVTHHSHIECPNCHADILGSGTSEVSATEDVITAWNIRVYSTDTTRCPFCGFIPNPDDPDCVYPSYISDGSTIWGYHCYETGGGCSVSVPGKTIQEATDKWETRR